MYEDVLGKMGIERKQLEPKILMAIADILQYSFLIKPEYGFICADETLPESLQFAEFKKFGQVGQTTVFIKISSKISPRAFEEGVNHESRIKQNG